MATSGTKGRAIQHPAPRPMSADEKRVIFASSLGTVFEWYDFYLFGVMAAIIPANFFTALDPNTRDIFTLLAFAAGFAVRPFESVTRIVLAEPGARLACASVLKTARIGIDERFDPQGRSLHVKQLVALKHWARPITQSLSLDNGRLTFHVLEAPDPAKAIVEFAERSQVDHIVMGARGRSALRRHLGSVSTQVVALSPCTVTVVRC